jgi:hypothetical protein
MHLPAHKRKLRFKFDAENGRDLETRIPSRTINFPRVRPMSNESLAIKRYPLSCVLLAMVRKPS